MSTHRVRELQGASCVCFVCGSAGAEYQLDSKPRYNGPYFPFLERHHCPSDAEKPGPDGVVSACFVCFSFLTQQWDAFEREKTPLGKRLYWLKRVDNGPYAGMDVKTQADYESNMFDFGSHHSDHRLDIGKSESSRSQTKLCHERPDSRESTRSSMHSRSDRSAGVADVVEETSSNALDLSMPSRASSRSSTVAPSPLPVTLEVCYLCAEESRSMLLNVFAKPIANCPFFPNLMWHPKPSNAKQMDQSGRIQVCELCHRFLLQQWDAYQRRSIPHSERTYALKRNSSDKQFIPALQNSNISSQDASFICFTCGMENSVSVQRILNAHPEMDGEPYFSFLEQIKPPPGALPLNSQGKGLVCSMCYKSLSRQLRVFQMSGTPEHERKYKILNEAIDSEGMSVLRQHLKGNEKIKKQDIVACYICERLMNMEQLLPLDTLPQNGNMYFPFIRGLLRPSFAKPMDHNGKVLVCLPCQMSLENQWKTFESAHIPSSQRQYTVPLVQSQRPENKSLLPYSAETSRNTNAALCIQVTSPDVQLDTVRSLTNHEPLLTTVSTVPFDSITTQQANFVTLSSGKPTDTETSHLMKHLIGHHSPRSKTISLLTSKHHMIKTGISDQQHLHSKPRISGPLDHSLGHPLLASINCFVCGEYSPSGHTFRVRATPDRSSSSSIEDHRINPFFPFLSKHTPSIGAECLAEDGSTLVCTFCFHSLIAQWLAYETSAQPEDDNCWQRKYNYHHYVCFICGIMTYRKRVRSITVLDFPFLMEHPRPPGALTLDNGESVVTCLTCFESLTSQWKDYERMKVPIEMRKYNWIVLPPPPENTDMNPLVTGGELSSVPPASVSRSSSVELDMGHTSPINHSSDKPEAISDNYKGLPHGSKPPPLTIHHPYGNSQKPTARSMTAVSPLQVPPHANNVFSTFSGGSNPTLAATRTSSFAAALCKLAKQAVDPIIEKELSPITPTTSPTQSQQSVSAKRPMVPNYFSNPQGTISLGSPPIVTMAPSQEHISHVVDSRKAIELTNLVQGNNGATTNDHVVEPLSLKLEGTKPTPMGLHFDKRNDHILAGKDFSASSSLSTQLRPPPPLTSSHSEDSQRGFQPYRSIDDTHHSLHSHMSPYEHPAMAAYPYSSAFLPHRHLSHPTYRLEESLYLERYGLPRTPVMHLHTPPGMLPHPSVPFYSNSRYPSDLLSHHIGLVSPSSVSFNHDRQKQEEEQRHQEHSRELISEQEMERGREEEREHERREYDGRWEGEHHTREIDISGGNGTGRTACSPLSTGLSGNSESPMNRLGSITQGTPRDFVIRKSVTPVTSTVAPLNLAVHPSSGQRASRPETELWPSRQVDASIDRVHHLPQEQEGIGYRHPLLLQQIQHHPSAGREGMLTDSSRDMGRVDNDGLVKHSILPPSRNNYDTKMLVKPAPDGAIRSVNNMGVPNVELNGVPRGNEHVHNSAFLHINDGRDNQKSVFSNHEHRNLIDMKGNENGLNKGSTLSMSDLWAAPSHLRHEGIHARLLETERTRTDSQAQSLVRERLQRNQHDDSVTGRAIYHLQNANRQVLSRNLQESLILPPIGKATVDGQLVDHVRVVSKLDLEEEKIRKARLNGTYNSDESESDSEEENDLNRLNNATIITKGPPLKLDTNPEKMKFLDIFGLITCKRRRDLEFQKYLKRRRILGRRSVSPPVEIEEDPEEKRDVLSPLPIPSKEVTERLRLSADYEEKVQLLRVLGLEPKVPDKNKERNKIWKTIPDDGSHRNGIVKTCDVAVKNSPNNKSSGHLLSKGTKRRFGGEDRTHNRLLLSNSGNQSMKLASITKPPDVILAPPLTHRHLTAAANKGSPPPLVSTPSQRTSSAQICSEVPQPPVMKVEPQDSNSRKNEDSNQRRVVIFSHSLPKDKTCHIKKDFVQEFHESVLQTTQQQLEHTRHQTSQPPLPPLNHSVQPPSRLQSTSTGSQSKDTELRWNHEKKHESSFHRWPGIEGVMEAYERYLSEQKLEQEVLTERCNYLRIQNQELNREAEFVSQRMSKLLQLRHQLNEERFHLQHTIGTLKSCLQQLR